MTVRCNRTGTQKVRTFGSRGGLAAAATAFRSGPICLVSAATGENFQDTLGLALANLRQIWASIAVSRSLCVHIGDFQTVLHDRRAVFCCSAIELQRNL